MTGTNGNQPVPPQNLEAEESILGAIMLGTHVLTAVCEIIDQTDFYREQHATIYRAALACMAKGIPIDSVTLTAELEERGDLDAAGGRTRIVELAGLVPASANAPHYARIVHEQAARRELIRFGQDTARIGFEHLGDSAEALHEVERNFAQVLERTTAKEERQAIGGATWLEQGTPGVPAVWGTGDVVLWAEGEPFMLYGPDGVGKTSICQQLVLHMCGVRLEPFLGLPVRRAERPILYVSADRPKQARRSLARMVGVGDYQTLDERLLVWEGPLPFSIKENPRSLVDFCARHGAGTLIIDSLKDVEPDLSKEESAARVAHAFQWLMAEGIDLCVLHHPRKAPAGEPARPKTFEDIYGNRILHGGFGSAMLIWGQPGDLIVDLVHLKQPADEYGPKQALHDHVRGLTTLFEEVVLSEILARVKAGLTVENAAGHLYRTDEPQAKHREKARRKLEKMVKDGDAYRDDDTDGTARYKAR